MKHSTWIALCALAAQATGGATAQTTAETSPQRAGLIKMVRGDVQVQDASGVRRPARAGETLAPAQQLLSKADAGASVVLRDSTTLVLGPSSQLELKTYNFDATTQDGGMALSLLRGSMRMVTGLIGKNHPQAVRIDTPTALIGVRGTDFIVQTEGQP